MSKRSKKKSKSGKRSELGLYGMKVDPAMIFQHEYKELINLSDEEIELRFQETLSNLKNEFLNSDPLSVLGCLATYGMSVGIDREGTIKKYGSESTQSNVELLQAILLSVPKESISDQQISPNIVQNFFDELPILSKTFQMRRFNKVKKIPKDKLHLAFIQEELRSHTQHVRNWGFLNDVIDIASEISNKIDFEFKEKHGFPYSSAIQAFKYILDDFESTLNKRIETISLLFKSKSVRSAVESFFSETGINEKPEEFLKYVEKNNLKIKEVQRLLWGYYDSYIGDSFILNSIEFSQRAKIELNELISIFDTFSLELGCMEKENPELFFLDNPVWSKPLVKIDNGKYFCALPTSFFSFILKILSGLCKEDKNLNRKLSQARASFLEDRIEYLFKCAFPEAQTLRNYKWSESDRIYENDFLIKVDSSLFIVEAKSHEITWPALRGAPDRIKKHVYEILYEPSIQSKRLEDRIICHKAGTLQLDNFPFDKDEIKSINRLSVTLDDFATLQTMVHQFKSVGWIPEDHQIAPCILCSDLSVIFDILDNKFHKINYLKRRTILPDSLSYKADEIDLLGLYLVCGFNTHSDKNDNTHLILTGMSGPIDDYYVALDSKTSHSAKPKPKLTLFWLSICKKLEERSTSRWSEAVSILLSLSFDEQKEFEKYYKKVIKNVKSNYRKMGNVDSAIFHSTYHKESSVALYAFRKKDIPFRLEKMENIASQVFEKPGIKRCLVIGQNIDEDERNSPYTTLAVFFQ